MPRNDHPLVALARKTIEAFVLRGETIGPPQTLTDEMRSRRGVFVSLHGPDGSLRGCIGTIGPTQTNVAAEIIQNAISAASRDPRFLPVGPDELDSLDISVDVLTEPESISSMAELDPRTYGVIVQRGHRRGLLLPDLDGVNSADYQVSIALQKAGISADEPYDMERFRVVRYHDA